MGARTREGSVGTLGSPAAPGTDDSRTTTSQLSMTCLGAMPGDAHSFEHHSDGDTADLFGGLCAAW